MKTVGFFNVKSAVGTTTLVYHLAWMYQELGIETVCLDLDPQADLTAAFLSDKHLIDPKMRGTIETAIEVLRRSEGDIPRLALKDFAEHLTLLPGDLNLSLSEDRFAEAWTRYTQGDLDGLRVVTSFYRVASEAARQRNAQLVLIDTGPGIGAINRAALAACDYIVIPLRTNLSSLNSLEILASLLKQWRLVWKRRPREDATDLPTTFGKTEVIGYVILQDHVMRNLHETLSNLIEGLSRLYHGEILGEPEGSPIPDPDPHQLATIKRFPSLLSLAQAAHKPMFLLKPADGASGGYTKAVLDCYRDFKELATRIASACGVQLLDRASISS